MRFTGMLIPSTTGLPKPFKHCRRPSEQYSRDKHSLLNQTHSTPNITRLTRHTCYLINILFYFKHIVHLISFFQNSTQYIVHCTQVILSESKVIKHALTGSQRTESNNLFVNIIGTLTTWDTIISHQIAVTGYEKVKC